MNNAAKLCFQKRERKRMGRKNIYKKNTITHIQIKWSKHFIIILWCDIYMMVRGQGS